VAQRDADREDPRPVQPRDAIDVADECREEIVRKEFRDDGLHECAGPGKPPRPCGKQPNERWTDSPPPSVSIDLEFGPTASLPQFIDVGDAGSNLAHGSSSDGSGRRAYERATTCAEGLGSPRRCGVW
jgi:hypothetical protein